jgi:hypothetical protein
MKKRDGFERVKSREDGIGEDEGGGWGCFGDGEIGRAHV